MNSSPEVKGKEDLGFRVTTTQDTNQRTLNLQVFPVQIQDRIRILILSLFLILTPNKVKGQVNQMKIKRKMKISKVHNRQTILQPQGILGLGRELHLIV